MRSQGHWFDPGSKDFLLVAAIFHRERRAGGYSCVLTMIRRIRPFGVMATPSQVCCAWPRFVKDKHGGGDPGRAFVDARARIKGDRL